MSTFRLPYQGKQTVVEYDSTQVQVNTYAGSQMGWLIDVVPPSEVTVTKTRQLQRLGQFIANYQIACVNPDIRMWANTAFLTKVLIHKGNVQ